MFILARSCKANWPVYVLAVMAACSANESEFLFDGLGDLEIVTSNGGSTVRVVDTIGTLDGDLAFGRIGPVAWSKGQLAIADLMSCTIKVIDVRTDELIQELGGCGSGPDQLSRITGVAYRADTLVVWDGSARTLRFFGDQGGLVRNTRVELSPTTVGTLQFGLVGESIGVVSSTVRPEMLSKASTSDVTGRLIDVFDVGSGAYRNSILHASRYSRLNPEPSLRSTALCTSQSSGHLAALNRWAFEGVVWDMDEGNERDHFWVRSRPYGIRPGNRGGTLPRSQQYVGCSEQFVIYKVVNHTDHIREVTGGTLLIRGYDGTMVADISFGADDSLFFGSVYGGQGRSFYLTSHQAYTGYPVLVRLEVPGTD